MIGIFPASAAIILVILALISMTAISFALLFPALRSARQKSRRMSEVADPTNRKRRQPARTTAHKGASRRKSIEETLRELEEQQKARQTRNKNPSLLIRMRQGGILWSKTTYMLLCIGIGAGTYLILLVNGLSPFVAVGFSAAVGLALPHFYILFRRKRRLKAFDAGLPDAVDIIVRGLRSGLPFTDCLRIVASETRAPVSTEFQTVVDDQLLGIPVAEATERLAELTCPPVVPQS